MKPAESTRELTEDGATSGLTSVNNSETEPLDCFSCFEPDVNPDAPSVGAYRKKWI